MHWVVVAIGGGVAVAAIGGTAEVMGHVAAGDYDMVGTFTGNPLAPVAASAGPMPSSKWPPPATV